MRTASAKTPRNLANGCFSVIGKLRINSFPCAVAENNVQSVAAFAGISAAVVATHCQVPLILIQVSTKRSRCR